MRNLLHNQKFINMLFAIPILAITIFIIVLKIIALIKYIGG